VAVTG
jgi:hypothetical protein